RSPARRIERPAPGLARGRCHRSRRGRGWRPRRHFAAICSSNRSLSLRSFALELFALDSELAPQVSAERAEFAAPSLKAGRSCHTAWRIVIGSGPAERRAVSRRNVAIDREFFMQLAQFPRSRFIHGPTPLEPLARLTKHLGGPSILVKRDDCTGLALGGNK